MTTTTSFWVPVEKLLILQDIVKSCGGYFAQAHMFGMAHLLDRVYVVIKFHEGESYRPFCEAWERANTNIVEVKSPWWKRLLRRL
jgi:hypothetical protein